jgi:hypothetical protein
MIVQQHNQVGVPYCVRKNRMTTWNYRVIRYKNGDLGIHEVYYNDEGIPVSCTENAVGVYGDGVYADGIEDMSKTLEHMRKALAQPIIDFQYFTDREKSCIKDETEKQ